MPRDFSRIDRIADLIQKELSIIIQREMRDDISLMTISRVIVSKDLAHAKVFIDVFAEEKAPQTLATLNQASGFLRSALAKRIQIRMIPGLTFIYDDSAVKAERLSKLIDEAVKSDHHKKDE